MVNYQPNPKYLINPEAELQGSALPILLASQNLYNFEDMVKKYGYDDVDTDTWYPLQDVFRFLHELTERHSATENMVSIGMKVFEVVPLPPEVQTITDGLHMFNAMNNIIQRNVKPKRDWYKIEEVSEKCIKLTDTGAYPHDLVYGEVYSMVRRLRPAGSDFTVKREYLNEDNPDSDGAIYHITLK